MKVHVLFGLLTSSLLFGSASATFTCAGSDNQTVCNALSAIYTATGGASWSSGNWGGGTSYCTPWFGLTCDTTNSIIISMNLNTNNLVGTIPNIWANMPSLTSLDLSGNSLVGPLPPSFDSLAGPPNYSTIHVHNNVGLNGTISRTLISNCMDGSFLTASCYFFYTGLVMPPPITWNASSFDPTTLLASISALTTQITSLASNASMASTQITSINNTFATNIATLSNQVTGLASNASMASAAQSRSIFVGLGGYSLTTFNTTARAAFSSAVATTLGAPASGVNITSIVSAANAPAGSGRHLMQAGNIGITFTVATPVPTNAAAVLIASPVFTAALATSFAASGQASPTVTAVNGVSTATTSSAAFSHLEWKVYLSLVLATMVVFVI